MHEQRRISRNFKGIIDTTLREGLQFSKANFSLDEMKKIMSYLICIGVDYIEVGNPIKKDIQEMITELVKHKAGASAKILSHIRNNACDLYKAIESRVDGVNILCTADQERLVSMNKTYGEYIGQLEKNIQLARENRLEVRVGAEDFFNQPFDRILKIYELAVSLKVERIGLADTLGKAMNWDVYRKIKDLRNHFSVDLEVHFHNDLGHSVSNAVTALQAGANWINTTLLGIGERTGITPLSSLLINLHMVNPVLTKKYNLSFLTLAENYVSEVCEIEIPLNLTTNRANGFAHKAGIHLNALIQHGPSKYELFSPELIGNNRKLIINSIISGRTNEKDVMKFAAKYG